MNSHFPFRWLRIVLLFLLAGTGLDVRAAEGAQEKDLGATNPVVVLPAAFPLTLTNVLAAAENRAWLEGPVWQVPPRGRTNDFAGVRVWIEGLIQLHSPVAAERGRKFRESVSIPVPATKTNWQTLHLLGGVAGEAEPSAKVADVVWRYTDGTVRRTPLQYGIHLRDWWGWLIEDPQLVADKHSKAVWHGEHPEARQKGKFIRLYLASLGNPDTNRVLKSLDLVSGKTPATSLILGLTLDVLPRGVRAPEFVDLDDQRPGLSNAQFVTVTDEETGKPVAGAEVVAGLSEGVGTDRDLHFQSSVRTDANGLTAVPKGAVPPDRLTLRIQSEEHMVTTKTLDAKKDGPIPPNVSVKLKRGVLIGGVVKDPDGLPLLAAKVQLNQMWRGQGGSNSPVWSDFVSQVVMTDAEGRWQTGKVPSEVLTDLTVEASHPDHLAPYPNLIGDNPPLLAALKALKYEIQMIRGGDVSGVVVGPEDAPISGAKVSFGYRHARSSFRETTTGSDGRFLLPNVRPEMRPVTATAPGFGPASKSVIPGTNKVEVTLKMKPVRKLVGVVLNPEGVPVEGAEVRYDPRDPQEQQWLNLDWKTQSDADGQFEWADAPDRELEVTVVRSPYAIRRNAKIKPGDEVNIIRLARVRKVLGVVGNEDTGEPVTKFSVEYAVSDEMRINSWSDSDRREFTDPEGHFTFDLSDERHNVIRVEADDFLPRQMVLPAAQDDRVQAVVLLKPSPQPNGVVVNPAGEPQAGVTVALTGGQNHLQMAHGRLTGFNPGSGVQMTDAQGRFKLRPTVNPGRVVAVSEGGYGEAPWLQFQQEPVVVLRSWGRIEGTIYSKGKPIPGRKVLLTLQRPGSFDNFHSDFSSYQATSDEQGKFVIEQVPPTRCSLAHLIETSPNTWLHSNPTPVNVLSGETTVLELGLRGATVSGRIEAGPLLADKPGAQILVRLGMPYPRPPNELNDPDALAAWHQSEAFKEASERYRNYNAVPEPDGSFSLDGVEPGSYTLTASAKSPKPEGRPWERDELGQFSQPLQIPGNEGGAGPAIDVGILVLKPTPPPPTVPNAPAAP